MAHDNHNSGTAEIWKVFGYLTIITIVEVALGIIRPGFLEDNSLFGFRLINWIFVGLTLVKAYYIVYYFMHAKYEKSSFRATFIYPFVLFATYATVIFLIEGSYLNKVVNHIQWQPSDLTEASK